MNSNKKIIKIFGEINAENGFEIANQIINTFSDDTISTLVLLIDSGGGLVSETKTISELLKMCDKEIISIGMNQVCSCATALFMMGNRRILFPDTLFIIHKVALTNVRRISMERMNHELELIKRDTKFIWEPVISNSDIEKELLVEKCKNDTDWVVTKEEAEKYRIVTEEYHRATVKELLS